MIKPGGNDKSIHTNTPRRVFVHRNKSRSVIGAARFTSSHSSLIGKAIGSHQLEVTGSSPVYGISRRTA